jgi:hypothetical protein
MKKLLLIFLIMGMIMPMVMATSYQYNTYINLKTTCQNSTGGLCSSSAICNISISYPNTTDLINGQFMENNGGYINYSLIPSQSLELGDYIGTICCKDGNEYNCGNFLYSIVGLGDELTIQSSIMYTIILVVLVIFMVLVGIGINNTKFANEYVEDGKLMINWFKYSKLILIVIFYGLLMFFFNFIWQLTSNIKILQFMSQFFMITYRISVYLALPLLVIILWVGLGNIILDVKLNKLLERGLGER